MAWNFKHAPTVALLALVAVALYSFWQDENKNKPNRTGTPLTGPGTTDNNPLRFEACRVQNQADAEYYFVGTTIRGTNVWAAFQKAETPKDDHRTPLPDGHYADLSVGRFELDKLITSTPDGKVPEYGIENLNLSLRNQFAEGARAIDWRDAGNTEACKAPSPPILQPPHYMWIPGKRWPLPAAGR
jgi:hypothetical protein